VGDPRWHRLDRHHILLDGSDKFGDAAKYATAQTLGGDVAELTISACGCLISCATTSKSVRAYLLKEDFQQF